ncbi:MAG: hypothetical protein N3B16_08245 [Candidatus Aminicenantes bacterium]|nr:hypothetical protein [Candidatus Aminicenantes bacterium]
MRKFDLGLLADWEYDNDFLQIIKEKAEAANLEVLIIWPENLEEIYKQLLFQEVSFKYILDRASPSSPQFNKLIFFAQKSGTIIFDPPEKVAWAADKATMHLEFISKGILTPYTLILPPFEEEPDLNVLQFDLSLIGSPFVIKPASMTGGGLGVIKNATNLDDIQKARQEFPQDKYLIQKKVEPLKIGSKRFWFRFFYSWGLVQGAWWNDETHFYTELSEEEIDLFSLGPLFTLTKKIQTICQLSFYSTEIVKDELGQLIVVDYVNENCDMRLQSKHYDGVPDYLVENIAQRLIDYVLERKLN